MNMFHSLHEACLGAHVEIFRDKACCLCIIKIFIQNRFSYLTGVLRTGWHAGCGSDLGAKCAKPQSCVTPQPPVLTGYRPYWLNGCKKLWLSNERCESRGVWVNTFWYRSHHRYSGPSVPVYYQSFTVQSEPPAFRTAAHPIVWT